VGETIQELDLVALSRDYPERGLVAGDVGAVVHIYSPGRAYEVEFVAADGRTLALMTLKPDDLEPVTGSQILHIRRLPPS
jgi:hypothetical protein